MSIMQNALIMFPDKDWYKKANGDGELKHTLDTAWERAVKIARASSPVYGIIDKSVTDDQILAVLAISEAWRVLRDILYFDEPDDSPAILKRFAVAKGLLATAVRLNRDTYIENTEHDRRAGAKVHRGQSIAGEARAAQIKEERNPIWDKWQELADKKWRGNSHLSKLEVAKLCSKELKGTEYQGSAEAIRKRISKPAR